MLHAFRACPKLDRAAAVQECPEVVEVSEMLARCLSVHWEWILLALLAAVGALIPQDRFVSAPSIDVPSSLWIIMCHPGATNTSGVISLVTNSLNKLMKMMHAYETNTAEAAYAQLPDADRPPYEEPPRRQVLAGGASMAANGQIMSCRQNRGAALAAECEVEGVFSWFQNEMGVDKAVPGKLWDGNVWHRPVMDKSRAFTVESPWFGFIAGAHIPEVFKATLNDAFGLRERLTVSFEEPIWLSIREIREACARLATATGKPKDFVAGLLLPLFKWSASREGGQDFKASEEDGARELADVKFDGHMDLQRQSFLKPGQHQQSKAHGKLRTKFDRMALAMHALYVLCKKFKEASAELPFTVDGDWASNFSLPVVISKNAIAMAYLLAEKCERTWKTLDFARSGHSLPPQVPPVDSQLGEGRVGAAGQAPHVAAEEGTEEALTRKVSVLIDTVGTQMKSKFSFTKESLGMVLPLGSDVLKKALERFPLWGCSVEVLREIMRLIWITPGRYFYYGKSVSVSNRVKGITKDHCPEYTVFFLLFAAKLLQAFGFGKVVMTTLIPGQGAGAYAWFFCKRVPDRADLVAVLGELAISDQSSPTLAACKASIEADVHPPPRAPVVDWTVVPETSQEDVADLAEKTGLVGQPEEVALAAVPVRDVAAQLDLVQVDADAAAQAAECHQHVAPDALGLDAQNQAAEEAHGFGV